MGGVWTGIDDKLRDLEHWVYQGHDLPTDHSHWYTPITNWGPFPPLSEMVCDARHLYEFGILHIPDADRLRDRGQTLAAIRDDADKLAGTLRDSLGPLQDAWQGPAALSYYAPSGFHADQVTPGGTAARLLDNLATVTSGMDVNAASHAALASRFSQMQGKQTNLHINLGIAVGLLAGTVALGGTDFEVTGPPAVWWGRQECRPHADRNVRATSSASCRHLERGVLSARPYSPCRHTRIASVSA